MQKTVLYATIAIIGLSIMPVQGAGVDFSGEWILTRITPSPGAGAQVPNVTLIITQTGNGLVVIRNAADEGTAPESINTPFGSIIRNADDRQKSIEYHYTLDGAESINTEPNAAGPVIIRSTSRWNNNTLVLEGTSTFEGSDKSLTTKWKREYLLSDNGAALAVSKTVKTPFGEVAISEIYLRK
jgi:hypothetical protein